MNIYFIGGAELVKIGFTAGDPRKRCAQLQVGSPHPLALLGAIPGTRATERRLHRRFAKYRVSREWFRLEGALRAFVETGCCPSEAARATSSPQPSRNRPRSTGEGKRAIGERLRATRQALGLSQIAFCSAAKISPSAYNQYERGKIRPATDQALLLCGAHRLTRDWIYRNDNSGLRPRLMEAIRAIRQAA